MSDDECRRVIGRIRCQIAFYREQMEAHEEQRSLAMARHDNQMVSYYIARWHHHGQARETAVNLLKKLEAKL